MCHCAWEIVHAMMHEAALELLTYSLIVALEGEREWGGGGKGEKEEKEREREGGERVVYRGGE